MKYRSIDSEWQISQDQNCEPEKNSNTPDDFDTAIILVRNAVTGVFSLKKINEYNEHSGDVVITENNLFESFDPHQGSKNV